MKAVKKGLTLLWLAALVGCGDTAEGAQRAAELQSQVPPEPDEAQEGEAEQAAEQAEPAPSPTQALMRGHFEQASDARAALIRGDLKTAQAAMQWLGNHPLQDLVPERTRELLAPMQAAARQFDEATTLREAGRALAQTLTQCGACHAASGKGPSFPLPELPKGDDPPNHMQRHLWAAERMLEGLVMNSTERFMAGASALTELPVALEKLRPPEQLVGELEALQQAVHEVQPRAVGARNAAERAEAYGDLLATCAACHRMLARGPI